MGANRLTGTPWHIEALSSNDGKRHRSRCVYYSKSSNYCRYHRETCRGPSYCSIYEEGVTPEERKAQKNVRKYTERHGDYTVTYYNK